MSLFPNPELKLAFEFVASTGLNIFLTGKAGTGKTTFLQELKKLSPKRMVVVAPTGVAAINAGGVTIHSFFQLPFTPYIPSGINSNLIQTEKGIAYKKDQRRFNREKLQIIKSLDLLVIDEISMVRADLLDSIDEVLRLFRDKEKPFGGIQLLMIGDLQQLSPVAKEDEWNILRNFYDSVYFFSSHALQKTQFISIELKQIFRQRDQTFIDLLNKVRENDLDTDTLALLNGRYIPGFDPGEEEGYIVLTTHNIKAKEINESKLRELPGKSHCFQAEIEGIFPEYAYPTDPELELKTGAQVMFVRNDTSVEKLYFNGKIGTIADIDEDLIYVQCEGEDTPIPVSPVEWSNIKYTLEEDSKEIREEITGVFKQYPLKTAWAITIHKSQGLTFEKAVIDARAAFTHGQVYVALSRCKTLEGLILSTPLANSGILCDQKVSGFISEIENNQPGQEFLERSQRNYYYALLMDLFDFSHIHTRLLQLMRTTREHKSALVGNISEITEKLLHAENKEINEVAVKFVLQLNNLKNSESNENSLVLQERTVKGITYFIEKLESVLLQSLPEIIYETDNKAIQKLIKDAIDNVTKEVLSKLYCLQSCKNGFSVKDYLAARVKAVLEVPEMQKKKDKKTETILPVKYPSLYNSLKSWRNQKMRELDVPAYMIIQTKTMAGLATVLPSTKNELSAVKGMGKNKIEKFGSEILSIISEFCRQNQITQSPIEIPQKSKKKKKGDSMELSFKMYKEGKTIPEIAAERSLASQTIQDHLTWYVGTGELSVYEFISQEKLTLIREYFIKADSKQLTPAKETLGQDVTFQELKFVLKYLEFLGEI